MMLRKRLAFLLPWHRRAAERDMRDELRSIAAMAEPGELGNLTLAAEDARAEWGWTRLEQTTQDVRYALRVLRKSPAFTATAVLSLALGIGASTALFTVLNTVAWKMLPVNDPEHLFVLGQEARTSLTFGFDYQQYELVRDRIRAMDLAAYGRVPLNVSIDGSAEPTADGLLVSGAYFPLLGVHAARGRALGPDDDRVPMGHPVVMISHAYWNSRFARDPGIIGRQLSLSGVPFTIVGVTPPAFFGVEVGTAPKFFVPVMMQPAVMPVSENLINHPNQSLGWLRVVGRVRSGVPPAQASAQLDALAHEDEWRPIDKFTGQRIDVRLTLTSAATGLSDLRRQFSLPLLILAGVVGIVLLIACANTATLVLARSAARRPEFALRLALGAGRSRLLRQVLVEGLVLAGAGGVCGVALAYWATQALIAYASAGQGTIALDVLPDARVLALTAGISVIAGLLFGSAPALRAMRVEITSVGRQELAGTQNARRAPAPGRALVILQIALSLMLLVAAGLFMRSLHNLSGQETGIDRSHILIVRVEPRGSDQRGIPGTSMRLDQIYRELLARVEGIAGVQSASLAHTSPLTPISCCSRFTLPSGDGSSARALMVYPHYFATMGLTVAKGRDFNEGDLRPDSPLVVLVNEAFVREVLNGNATLGAGHGLRVTRFSRTPTGEPPPSLPLDIIGVVQDSPYPSLREAATPIIYQTFLQTNTGRGQMVLHVRVAENTGVIARQIRDAVQAVDRIVPIFEIHTLADEMDAVLVRERLIAMLSGFFGLVALALASVGLYGLMAFTVSRRTAEIGIRVALGATSSNVRWMVVRQTLTLVLVGIALGVPAAWIVGRLAARQLSAILFELTPSDPSTIVTATMALVVVAVAAGLLPARRAARIDPIVALRNE